MVPFDGLHRTRCGPVCRFMPEAPAAKRPGRTAPIENTRSVPRLRALKVGSLV